MASSKHALTTGHKAVTVEIGLDKHGRITVSPDPFWVSKGKKEEVVWKCAQNHPHDPNGIPCFTVDFNKHNDSSPFENWHFQGHEAHSDCVRSNVIPDEFKVYSYTVSMHGKSLDPGGGVKP